MIIPFLPLTQTVNSVMLYMNASDDHSQLLLAMNIAIDAGIMIRNKQTGSRLKYDADPTSYETCYDTVEGVPLAYKRIEIWDGFDFSFEDISSEKLHI